MNAINDETTSRPWYLFVRPTTPSYLIFIIWPIIFTEAPIVIVLGSLVAFIVSFNYEFCRNIKSALSALSCPSGTLDPHSVA
jgi:hypothetical protein